MPLTLRGAPGRRRRREPRVRRPAVLDDPEPLAEGGFVLSRSLVLVATAGVLVLVGAAAAVAGPAAARPTAAAVPQRIVSLSPTATESLFAIGAGPQVIAV